MNEQSFSITIETNLPDADWAQVNGFLEDANAAAGFPRNAQVFTALLRNPNGGIEGGIRAHAFWDWMYVAAVAVARPWRGLGYGRQLLSRAEVWGRESCGCHSAWLMTMSFQAGRFYEAAGYERFAELPLFPEGSSRLFLRKSLRDSVFYRREAEFERTEKAE